MQTQPFACGTEYALTVLGGKWKVVILAHLKERPHRYAELRSVLPGLRDKVLTERLRELVEAGLVDQQKDGGRGAPSTYRLSARGEGLRPVLGALYEWGLADAAGAGITIGAPRRDRRA